MLRTETLLSYSGRFGHVCGQVWPRVAMCGHVIKPSLLSKQRCDAQNLSFQSLNPKDSCNDSRSNMR